MKYVNDISLRQWIIGAAAFCVVTLGGCRNDDPDPIVPPPPPSIPEIVASNNDFSLLNAAIQHAGLGGALSAAGPFTVFAPTNQAFNDAGFNSPADIQAQDSELIASILTYHVVSGRVASANLTAGEVQTLNPDASAYISTQTPAINGVPVAQADVDASNGIIHVIESVLLPPSENLVEIAAGNDDFSELVAAVLKVSQETGTDVAALLSGDDGAYTVFAPTNDAFEALYDVLGVSGVDEIPAETLLEVLTYHVVSGRVFSTDLSDGVTPATLAGANLTINVANNSVTVTGAGNDSAANVAAANILATNGVIHVIDQVLLPAEEE